MRKSVGIFLVAVILPSAGLGWLALRNAREQQMVIERRTAELYQSETDNAAAAVRAIIDEQRRAFADVVGQLLASRPPAQVANTFAASLAQAWQRPCIGFAIDAQARILSPTVTDAATHADWKRFLWDNGQFLSNQMAVTVFPVAVDELNRPELLRKNAGANPLGADNASRKSSKAYAPSPAPANADAEKSASPAAASQKASPPAAQYAQNPPSPQPPMSPQNPSSPQNQNRARGEVDAQRQDDNMVRNVAPQQMLALSDRGAYSQLSWATAGFKELTGESDQGMVTRFVQDRLELIIWRRFAQAPGLVFGCLIEAQSLRDLWPEAFAPDAPLEAGKAGPEFVLALLDDKARPVSRDPAGSTARDWKRPFVASEIGEALPHWEAALYLSRPELLRESAGKVRRTLFWLIATALGAIACGGWLVVADTRRQLELAQKKTDFVSNVSHELKTPLTSIRMFAELMASGRAEPARHAQYLKIIMVESERLTRLINNVLDFAGMERRQKRNQKSLLDLHEVLESTWESHELHLKENGFATRRQEAPGPYPVLGDEDALAQILVNLLSNAEKYSGPLKEIELHSYLDGKSVCISVLDRGTGVPDGEERKVFEAFYRAHDSLSSGIQGSGLGLTLAQGHARDHSGEILYQSRTGGGSIFTLRLPLAATPDCP